MGIQSSFNTLRTVALVALVTPSSSELQSSTVDATLQKIQAQSLDTGHQLALATHNAAHFEKQLQLILDNYEQQGFRGKKFALEQYQKINDTENVRRVAGDLMRLCLAEDRNVVDAASAYECAAYYAKLADQPQLREYYTTTAVERFARVEDYWSIAQLYKELDNLEKEREYIELEYHKLCDQRKYPAAYGISKKLEITPEQFLSKIAQDSEPNYLLLGQMLAERVFPDQINLPQDSDELHLAVLSLSAYRLHRLEFRDSIDGYFYQLLRGIGCTNEEVITYYIQNQLELPKEFDDDLKRDEEDEKYDIDDSVPPYINFWASRDIDTELDFFGRSLADGWFLSALDFYEKNLPDDGVIMADRARNLMYWCSYDSSNNERFLSDIAWDAHKIGDVPLEHEYYSLMAEEKLAHENLHWALIYFAKAGQKPRAREILDRMLADPKFLKDFDVEKSDDYAAAFDSPEQYYNFLGAFFEQRQDPRALPAYKKAGNTDGQLSIWNLAFSMARAVADEGVCDFQTMELPDYALCRLITDRDKNKKQSLNLSAHVLVEMIKVIKGVTSE